MIIRALQRSLKTTKKTKVRGFTLMELLISIAIASVVTTGLLYLVNELISVDRQEAKLDRVQRDMQRAMNYIADDLRESVYVYPDPTVVTAQLTPADLPPQATLPGGGATATPVPVLAFWKPESLSPQDHARLPANCDTIMPAPPAPNRADCNALKLRQSYYSLVVYFSMVNADDNPNWPGMTRIIRYTLPQFTQANMPSITRTDGFVPPDNDFANWTIPVGVTTNGDWNVLVDHVDSGWSAHGPLVAADNLGATPPVGCEAELGTGSGYTRSPVDDGTNATLSNSFSACVSPPGSFANGSNQDVVVFLRGNIKTAAEEIANPTDPNASRPTQSLLPTLKTQVLVRGAANKNPL